MGLDFVLEHLADEFLATERKKLNYFVEVRKIAREDLPTKLYASPHGHAPAAKHFVESYPIFLATREGNRIPHFCYVDEGLQTTDRFATFLSQYRRLLRALGDFHVIYVAEHSRLLESAKRVFQKFLDSISLLPNVQNSEEQELLSYFRRRRAYEDRDFSNFDTAGLIRFREDKTRFAGERYEALYATWKARDGAASDAVPELQLPAPARFSTFVLAYDYDLFGTLTSKDHKRRNAEIPTEL
jgi:hypothetical protein